MTGFNLFLAGGCIGGLIGVILGGLSMKTKVVDSAMERTNLLCKLIIDMATAHSHQMNLANEIHKTQEKIIASVQKEKRLLQKQLDEATDTISEMEETLSGIEPGQDDEEDEPVVPVHRNVAADKLITIQKLLEDASEKGDKVDPNNLLGIVKFPRQN